MVELLKEKSNYGQVMVYIGCSERSPILDARQRLKEVYPELKNLLSDCTYGLYTLECKYSMEDQLYPLLKEIYKTVLKEDGIILGFGVFLSGMYTELIVLDHSFKDQPINIFKVGAIDQIEGREYGRILAKLYALDNDADGENIQRDQKDFPSNIALRHLGSKPLPPVRVKLSDGTENPTGGIAIVRNASPLNKLSSKTLSDGTWHMFVLEAGKDINVPYSMVVVTDGRENMYWVNALQYQKTKRLLAMWESFFFLPSVADMKRAIETGFCVDLGGHIRVIANPGKSIPGDREETKPTVSLGRTRREGFTLHMQKNVSLPSQ